MSLADYEILGELVRGGGHVSYRARRKGQTAEVCLQVLPLDWWGYPVLPGHLDSFLASLEVVALLDHPNIVPVLAVGRHDSGAYLVRPLPARQTLGRLLNTGPAEPRRAAAWALQLAGGIGHAHEHGVFSPDLSPHEIQLGDNDEVRLANFDLAFVRFLHPPLPPEPHNGIMGVPLFCSPEKLRGESRADDPRLDVWALGVLLFRLAVGQPPFSGSSVIQVMQAIIAEDVASPRELRPDVPADLEKICLRCLEKNPEQRYAGMPELAADLQAFLAGRPITPGARMDSLAQRMGRWVRGWWPAASGTE